MSGDGTPNTPDERNLLLLLDIAIGRGQWAWTGPYLHTYPGTELHDACLELERRELLQRHINEPNHVCWVAGPAVDASITEEKPQ